MRETYYMRIYMGVENFAKIESAEICINQYTLLVGPNNSGKTFLMQLAEGINEKLDTIIHENDLQFLKEEQDSNCNIYTLTQDSLDTLTERINLRLDRIKESIIIDTLGQNIPVDRIYLRIEVDPDEKYQIIQYFEGMEVGTKHPDNDFLKNIFKVPKDRHVIILKKMQEKEKIIWALIGNKSSSNYYIEEALLHLLTCKSLFMPASRTGLMLLYREFFAHKTDDSVSVQFIDGVAEEQQPRILGLTKPVYKFLRFLQTVTPPDLSSSKLVEYLKNDLHFYENNIIEGHISINEQGNMVYSVKDSKINVPMYLASSMINEIAPLYLAITSSRDRFRRLIIDEIESSLHPEKQMELVRFLNRLYNLKFEFIISTHSDTFVSRLNNLCLMAEYTKRTGDKAALKKLHLEESDLVCADNLCVYEFVNKENGKSVVREVPFNDKLGYQFDLFTDSALKLYNEATQIQEIINNEHERCTE